ncbi:MAG: BLUF domain-containing protein [Rubrobacter sp.]
MFFLTYASSATGTFLKEDLALLLAQCRENNSALGITGMLLYKDGNFMQVLEGEEEAVRKLYAKIESDPRHKGTIVFQQGYAEERQFPNWSMGFRDLNSSGVGNIPGYSEFLNTPLTRREFSENPTRSQKLLLTFKKSM